MHHVAMKKIFGDLDEQKGDMTLDLFKFGVTSHSLVGLTLFKVYKTIQNLLDH